MKQLHIHAKKIPYTYNRFFRQYRSLSEGLAHHVLLESGRGGRYSIAAFEPEAILTGKNSELEILRDGEKQVLEGNPLHLMQEWLNQYKADKLDELPDFQGGAIGFISYDYARYIEKLPNEAQDDLQIPDIHFFIYKECFVFDHETKELWLIFLYEKGEEHSIGEWAENWEQRWKNESEEPSAKAEYNQAENTLGVSMNEEEFMAAVRSIQEYISQGDVFQVNLSVRQSRPIHIQAMEVYEQLRVLNPSPYMGYFHTPGYQLVSGSPELLIKKKGNTVSTRPIAGTRSRGKDHEEDLKLASELIENEKERAEHVMLVDLERNDLGRVCKYGTVTVDEFMVIEKYSHVMHIVSNVKGELADGKNAVDIIDAVFPGGTITGAPKVRTMEIIEELEPVTRGPYTGSLGWINFSGDLELNIIIRTMLVKEGQAHVQAGAGIVIDSNPKNEYKESLKKAIALWKAKELAEQAKGDQL
ncbi:aminodeoxychorismate synthase, component I [Cytobacillus oceanisediminis]|uniref:aminodeoxychorismate synthase, component I n=1 Tax=Cytobacillus TaxID=2675230 RepID=UPI00203C1305|nr:aminodeoxychorismate synthase, component I [Cytobacillus oceanisediminis]MBY0159408.1 aminodeoxychorismate synthase, component I [Cytobacillus firmus]MCM3395789.1 aminodeoxychorismate synthase, component I [Cytobacillus oceanisediminis]MCM3532376.1 aminodeoxychorismate synthase, component I [Cytobacillus oceanisediminis]